MTIDLSKIDEKGIIIDEVVSFNEDYLKNTQIKELNNIKVNGRVYYSVTNEVILECTVKGTMKLLDAMDLEPIDYPLNIEISEVLSEEDEENSKKEAKTLDIMDVLWQNIVLEVPISIRRDPKKVYDLKGEGWELVNDESKKVDPRLAPLLELLDKEGKEWKYGSSF